MKFILHFCVILFSINIILNNNVSTNVFSNEARNNSNQINKLLNKFATNNNNANTNNNNNNKANSRINFNKSNNTNTNTNTNTNKNKKVRGEGFETNKQKEYMDLYVKTKSIPSYIDGAIKQNCSTKIKKVNITQIPTIKIRNPEYTYLYNYYDITNGTKSANKLKAVIIGGEHARELITVDIMVNFLTSLCNNKSNSSILDKYDLRLIVNVTGESRIKVENGDFCLRVNPNKIDVNRNYDFEFGKKLELKEEYSGQVPLSELESQFVDHAVSTFQPHVFLTLHSGTFGLFYPFAYKEDSEKGKTYHIEKNTNKKYTQIIKQVTNNIKQEFCKNCDAGAPSGQIGYISSGTSLDYFYIKKNVPITFAWEVFTYEDIDKKPFIELEEFKKKNANRKKTKKNKFVKKTMKKRSIYSSFKELFDKSLLKQAPKLDQLQSIEDDKNDCFQLFNPKNKTDYDFTVLHWIKAINSFLSQVHKLAIKEGLNTIQYKYETSK